MSDPFRQISHRRLPPFPRGGSASPSVTLAMTLAKERPPSRTGTPLNRTVGPGVDLQLHSVDSVMALTPDLVKSYLCCHQDVLDEHVMESVSVEKLETWLRRKKDNRNSLPNIAALSQSQKPVLQDQYCNRNMQEVEEWLSTDLTAAKDKLHCFYMLANVVASATKSDGFTVYSVSANEMELNTCVPGPEEGSYKLQAHETVGPLSTVSAHVAKTKHSLLVKDLNGDDRFPNGVGAEKSNLIQSVLCVPITLPSGSLLGVLEFSRSWQSAPFKQEELQTATSILALLGTAMHQCQVNHALRQQSELNDFLLEFSKSIFDDIIAFDLLVSKIMMYTKNLVLADRCSLFQVDHDKGVLFSDFIDEGKVDAFSRPVFTKSDRIRFDISKGIAGHVARTGEIVNIPDAYADPRFNREIDKVTGYTTKSILCMPIISHGSIIGVVQMINKVDSSMSKAAFTSTDEESFKLFAMYSALALHYSKVYAEVKQQSAQLRIAVEQLGYHLVCSKTELQQFLEQPMMEEDQIPELDSFFFYGPDNHEPYLHRIVINMVVNLFGPEKYDLEKLCRFVLTVKKNYRIVPYHNWKHGFNVAHCIYVMLLSLRPRKFLSDIEEQALFFAALCHDLDHRGYNNAFFTKFSEPLADLYQNAIMEQHHYAHTVLILQQAGHNVFEDLTGEQFKLMLETIKEAIIATDLVLYFSNQKQIGQKLLASTLHLEEPDHKKLVISIMMTGADLCAMCKPWPCQREEVTFLYHEFYGQGDLEKDKGHNPLPLMDRENVLNQPKDQIGFIQFVCHPCYKTLTDIFPEMQDLLTGLMDNLFQWERVAQGKATGVWEPARSVVTGD